MIPLRQLTAPFITAIIPFMSQEESKERVPTNPQILESLLFVGAYTLLENAKKHQATSSKPMRTYEALIAIANTPEEKKFAQLVKHAAENAATKGRTGTTYQAVAEVVSRLLGKSWD